MSREESENESENESEAYIAVLLVLLLLIQTSRNCMSRLTLKMMRLTHMQEQMNPYTRVPISEPPLSIAERW